MHKSLFTVYVQLAFEKKQKNTMVRESMIHRRMHVTKRDVASIEVTLLNSHP